MLRKDKDDNIWRGRLVSVFALGVLVILVLALGRIFFKDYELRGEINRLQSDVGSLQKKKIESLDLLQKLQSDSFLEEKARQELQARRFGETVLVVPGVVVSSSAAVALPLTPKSPELANPQKWWYYFFRYGKRQ